MTRLNQVPERTMQIVRWGLAISWLFLIASLFYDPISAILTAPDNLQSPFRIHPETCILLQDECLVQKPYSLGVRLFWSAIVPAAIFVIFVFGHDVWRRMCPLSFFSQLPRALKLQRQQKMVGASGIVSYEVVTISAHSWLGQNHLYVQFGLFFVGLTIRLLLVNSHPLSLGIFLIVTILAAMLVGFLYAGKSWCNYFCPFAPVQAVFTGPMGLLGSSAHQQSESGVSQSMCRTTANESACVGCKSPCIDIDAEQAYWENLEKPARRFVQYGYVGILVAFFLYFYLFAGNWDYYFSGAWSRDDAIGMLFSPGFYLLGHAIPLPKLIAVPLTLAIFTALAYFILSRIEKIYRAYLRQQHTAESRQRSHHVMFTLTTVFSLWFFFCFGGRPILNSLPSFVSLGFNAIVTIVGSLWMYRTWGRTQAQYEYIPAPMTPLDRDREGSESVTASSRQQLERIAVVDGERLQFKPKSSDGNTTLVKSGNKNRSDTTQTRPK
jgi:polyferredoxin